MQERAALESCQSGTGSRRLPIVVPGRIAPGTSDEPDDYFLVSHPNPTAPGHGGGRKGFWRDGRTEPIRGVVIHTLDSTLMPDGYTSAAGAAVYLSQTPEPESAHVVIDGHGPVWLLPTSETALHSDEADGYTVAVIVLQGLGEEAGGDAGALRHAAKVTASLLAANQIPAERRAPAELLSGRAGLVDGGELDGGPPSLDWTAFLASVQQAAARKAPVPVGAMARIGGNGNDCEAEREAVAAAEQAVEDARADAEAAEARYEQAVAAAERRASALDECECNQSRRARRRMPRDDDQDETDDSRYYLLANPNPNAPPRGNGKQGWYRPMRTLPIQGLVIHTAEAGYSVGPTDDTASRVASYFASTVRPASAHACTDSSGRVDCLPDEYVAFHARGANQSGLGLEIGYDAHLWGTNPIHEELLLEQAAAWCAEKCVAYDIPVELVTGEQWRAGQRGITAHGYVDPARRTDPGPNFPWARFLSMVEQQKAFGAASAAGGMLT